jgi:hypothetical protein
VVIIEPYDEIQVFVVGLGDCFWGRIQPTCRRARTRGALGGVDLELTVEPLFETVTRTRQAGVTFRDGMVAPLIGKKVHIPQRLVDVIFGDERHLGT